MGTVQSKIAKLRRDSVFKYQQDDGFFNCLKWTKELLDVSAKALGSKRRNVQTFLSISGS